MRPRWLAADNCGRSRRRLGAITSASAAVAVAAAVAASASACASAAAAQNKIQKKYKIYYNKAFAYQIQFGNAKRAGSQQSSRQRRVKFQV